MASDSNTAVPAVDGGTSPLSFGWYREFDATGKKTFWACFLGYALDAFELQIYSFVMPVLVGLWSMTNTQAGLIATSALAISAFGGWLAGMLADKIGRVRLLQITVAWFAFFTFLSGFTHSFRSEEHTSELQSH